MLLAIAARADCLTVQLIAIDSELQMNVAIARLDIEHDLVTFDSALRDLVPVLELARRRIEERLPRDRFLGAGARVPALERAHATLRDASPDLGGDDDGQRDHQDEDRDRKTHADARKLLL